MLVLVNNQDKIIGKATKEECHRGEGLLHRAFSIYIFNDKAELLIQQRSKFKKLWPLYWSNTCCSHLQENENYVESSEKRLKQELGFSSKLITIGKFSYQARYRNIGSENEMCAILFGKYSGIVRHDQKEVANWQWISINDLKMGFKKNPEKYTPWLKLGFLKYLDKFSEKM